MTALLGAAMATGCVLDNPSFDGLSGAETGVGAASYGASWGSSDGLSGGDSEGEDGSSSEGDSEGASGGLSEGASSSGGETSGSVSDGADTDTDGTGTDTDGVDTGADTGTADTTGGDAGIEVGHASDASCDQTFWCLQGQVGAVNLPVECFDVGIAPPYIVDRVDFQVFARKGAPPTAIEIYEYDAATKRPFFDPIATQWLGAIDGEGKQSVAIDPVEVSTPRVCVGVRSGDALSTQLGIATTGAQPPWSTSFLGGSGGCTLPTHTDVRTIGGSPWCISAFVHEG
ncbi:MAG: hypothetical protein H6710_18265 [Myxococcales bacterium]|nr:hypothetical protein [Myxococcales bacterium]